MVTVHERELLRSRQVARKAMWEGMMTEGGMTIVVHPAAVNAGAHGWVCDTYAVR
jgi:hypothetical protein